MTMARWLRLRRKSRSSSFSRLRLGHEHRRAQQGAQVQLGRALQLEQVLGHQDADDVVALALVDREARVRGLDDQAEQLVVAARRCRAGPCAVPPPSRRRRVMSAMRSTPSSIRRDSGSISSRCSASASVSISSARESGPGDTNSISRSNRERLSLLTRGRREGWGSDTKGVGSGGGRRIPQAPRPAVDRRRRMRGMGSGRRKTGRPHALAGSRPGCRWPAQSP